MFDVLISVFSIFSVFAFAAMFMLGWKWSLKKFWEYIDPIYYICVAISLCSLFILSADYEHEKRTQEANARLDATIQALDKEAPQFSNNLKFAIEQALEYSLEQVKLSESCKNVRDKYPEVCLHQENWEEFHKAILHDIDLSSLETASLLCRNVETAKSEIAQKSKVGSALKDYMDALQVERSIFKPSDALRARHEFRQATDLMKFPKSELLSVRMAAAAIEKFAFCYSPDASRTLQGIVDFQEMRASNATLAHMQRDLLLGSIENEKEALSEISRLRVYFWPFILVFLLALKFGRGVAKIRSSWENG